LEEDVSLFYYLNRETLLAHYTSALMPNRPSMMKAKFGNRIRSKTGIAQTNEMLLKVLAHNICVVIQSMYELGIELTFTTHLETDVTFL
jgi:hypothetical protein